MAGTPDPGHLFTESSGNLILGDLIYGSGADTAAALAGNITITKKFLNQTGNGSVSAAPVWSILAAGDIPDISGTYSVKAGNTSLVTVGTIGTGTWNADVIADGKIATALTGKTYNALTPTALGTGFTIAGGTIPKTLTVTGDATISGTPLSNPMTTLGDIIYGGASGAATRLGGAAGFLKSTGAAAPAWSAVSLTADVSGILPTANGGTGIAFFTAAGPTVARVYTFPDAAATVLTSNTAVTAAQGGTGQAGGYTIGDLLYASGATTLSKLADVATGNALISGGVGVAPSWGKIGLAATGHVTGNLPVANLNSGTGASATTFWRGDATWATPAGGNSGQPYYPTRQWCYLRPVGTTATVFTSVGCAAFVITGVPAASAQTDSYYIAHPSAATIDTLAGITQTFIQTQGRYRPKLTVLIRTDATIDLRRIWVALTPVALTLTDGVGAFTTRYVGVRYSTSAGDTAWQCASGDGTTGSVVSTGVAVAVSTAYKITVDWSVNGTLTCTVNGTSVNKTTNLDTTQTAALGLHAALTTLSAVARTHRTAFIHLETN